MVSQITFLYGNSQADSTSSDYFSLFPFSQEVILTGDNFELGGVTVGEEGTGGPDRE